MITEEQREARKLGLGGSDLPIILGLSNYKTPYQLFLEKRGLLESTDEMSPPAYWGNRLESVVREEFALRNKVEIETPDTLVHPFYTFMRANIDGYIKEWDAILEVKCSSGWQRDEWGPAGSDIIPMAYLVQVAHYCIVTNASCAHIALLLGGNDYREYKYTRHDEIEAMVLRAGSNFWDSVQNGDAPPPVNEKDLKLLHPRSKPAMKISATPEIISHFDRLKKCKREIDLIEPTQKEHKFNIMKFMGEADTLIDNDGKIMATYKSSVTGSRTFLPKGYKDE